MLGFEALWKVFEFVFEELSKGRCAEQDRLKEHFDSIVEPSYKELENIHADYTAQLSALRKHIHDKTLPPYELIDWLRTAGIQYRAKRDALRTFESCLPSLSEIDANPLSDRPKERFAWHFRQYAEYLLKYIKCTTSGLDVSYYRDYEHQLSCLLHVLEDQSQSPAKKKIIAEIFYETDYVMDMHDDLANIADRLLPKAWMNVSQEYRELQAIISQL